MEIAGSGAHTCDFDEAIVFQLPIAPAAAGRSSPGDSGGSRPFPDL